MYSNSYGYGPDGAGTQVVVEEVGEPQGASNASNVEETWIGRAENNVGNCLQALWDVVGGVGRGSNDDVGSGREKVLGRGPRRGRGTAGGRGGRRNVDGSGRSGMHYSEEDAVHLAQVWVTVSQRHVQSDYGLWTAITGLCQRRYGLKRSKHALCAKWKTLQPDCFTWISGRSQIYEKYKTGNYSELELRRMTHKLFTSRKCRDRNPVNVNFKYVEAAEFLMKFPKFTDVKNDEDDRNEVLGDMLAERSTTGGVPGMVDVGGGISGTEAGNSNPERTEERDRGGDNTYTEPTGSSERPRVIDLDPEEPCEMQGRGVGEAERSGTDGSGSMRSVRWNLADMDLPSSDRGSVDNPSSASASHWGLVLRHGLKRSKEQPCGCVRELSIETSILSKMEKHMGRGTDVLVEMVKRQKVNQASERIFMALVAIPRDAPGRGHLCDRLTQLAGVEGYDIDETGPVGSSGNDGAEEPNGSGLTRDGGSGEDAGEEGGCTGDGGKMICRDGVGKSN